ncbi:hypothetical protein [Mordavella massiliensis]|uniref:Uncharacterized protein n=1 Tax=Mordavella massiliensis TaxID=1871024 RepID=A0A939BHD9_9CLOT|nr:hypothetical protein [Mordavella massiliensis]MBM6949060.1 hypothetical protein [Mordavella massiliensis]
MKRYIAEIIIFCMQLFMFYISPLLAGPTDGMGMVAFILFATLILSILLGSISKNRIKYLYPAAAAVVFLPSVFLHYNGTAFVHAVWYFVVAAVGMLIGTIIFKVLHRM